MSAESKRYDLVRSRDPEKLVELVNSMLADGWELHGDTFMTPESDCQAGEFYQAVVLPVGVDIRRLREEGL